MANVTVGGDPESYMDPPRISSGDGGPSIIASILGLLGVTGGATAAAGKIAGGAQQDSGKQFTAEITPPAQQPVSQLPALNAAEMVFKPFEPALPEPGSTAARMMESLRPLIPIDPNFALDGKR